MEVETPAPSPFARSLLFSYVGAFMYEGDSPLAERRAQALALDSALLAELQHRVRNIMAMIRSMTLRTADGALDVEDYRSLLERRLLALARVQVLLTQEANAGGSLR